MSGFNQFTSVLTEGFTAKDCSPVSVRKKKYPRGLETKDKYWSYIGGSWVVTDIRDNVVQLPNCRPHPLAT